MQSVVACGVAKAIKQLEPQSDKLTQRQAYAFLRKRDTEYGGQAEHGEAWLKRKVEDGSLHPRRRGKSLNSPLIYSKAELLEALAVEEALKENIFRGTNL
jgi:hypothetical protein